MHAPKFFPVVNKTDQKNRGSHLLIDLDVVEVVLTCCRNRQAIERKQDNGTDDGREQPNGLAVRNADHVLGSVATLSGSLTDLLRSPRGYPLV
jgi:hypothetical protein